MQSVEMSQRIIHTRTDLLSELDTLLHPFSPHRCPLFFLELV